MKIQQTVLGNKEVILDPTFGGHKKLNERWGLSEGGMIAADFIDEFCIDAIWTAIKRKRFFKPFITKKRMKKHMKPWDLDRIKVMVDYVYTGRIFTEEELDAKVKEQRERIEEEIRKIREDIRNAGEAEIESMTENQLLKASDVVKKNG